MGSSLSRAARRREEKHPIPGGDRRCPECGGLMAYHVDRQEFFCGRHGSAGYDALAALLHRLGLTGKES